MDEPTLNNDIGMTRGFVGWRKRKKKRDATGKELDQWEEPDTIPPAPEKPYDPLMYGLE